MAESAGLGDFDEDKPKFQRAPESMVRCLIGHRWSNIDLDVCRATCKSICDECWVRVGGGFVNGGRSMRDKPKHGAKPKANEAVAAVFEEPAKAMLAKQCKKCPAKKAWKAQEQLKKFLGEHKPKPRGSLAEDLGNNLQATQEQILSTLNAAERRIVERRFVIKPKRQEA